MIFGGKPSSYIKVKEIEQTSDASNFAIPYIDNGIFKIRVMSEKEIHHSEHNRGEAKLQKPDFVFNRALGINDYTEPNR